MIIWLRTGCASAAVVNTSVYATDVALMNTKMSTSLRSRRLTLVHAHTDVVKRPDLLTDICRMRFSDRIYSYIDECYIPYPKFVYERQGNEIIFGHTGRAKGNWTQLAENVKCTDSEAYTWVSKGDKHHIQLDMIPWSSWTDHRSHTLHCK